MKIANGQFSSIEQVTNQYLINKDNTSNTVNEKGKSFAEILNRKSEIADERLKFSKHASMRLENRNIELSDNQLDRLEAGAKRANAKGINESLVLVDQLAFIVNIKNSTVITAMDQSEAQENVFTNIDGAVIA